MNSEKEIALFTDGSVNTQTKVGYGAYLVIDDYNQPLETFISMVKLKRFEQTSSSKLELQILLHALNELDLADNKVIIYTDSQNIIHLPNRRERFVRTDFRSKNGKILNHAQLYCEFFALIENLNCEFVKITGHQPTVQKNQPEKIFTLVDKASRNALRLNY